MKDYNDILETLRASGNLRSLPDIVHRGKWIEKEGQTMLNLSSNDYLGLSSRQDLRDEFIEQLQESGLPFSSSSSRLLTGNFMVYTELEELMANRFGREAALLFNSGYHANTGILPALTDKQSLILADKLVHASIIDGILLSGAPYQRYRHNDYEHLEQLLAKYVHVYEQIIIVTESIFSMDGDIADLGIRDIDLLVGTFGKALGSMGAYLLCSQTVREYLINTMRPLIFSTALPPAQIAWTKFLFERLPSFTDERHRLAVTSHLLSEALKGKGGEISASHIIPFIIGENEDCIQTSLYLQRKGFYCLPVRPPTVPKGTARIRFSLTADITEEEIRFMINEL